MIVCIPQMPYLKWLFTGPLNYESSKARQSDVILIAKLHKLRTCFGINRDIPDIDHVAFIFQLARRHLFVLTLGYQP